MGQTSLGGQNKSTLQPPTALMLKITLISEKIWLPNPVQDGAHKHSVCWSWFTHRTIISCNHPKSQILQIINQNSLTPQHHLALGKKYSVLTPPVPSTGVLTDLFLTSFFLWHKAGKQSALDSWTFLVAVQTIPIQLKAQNNPTIRTPSNPSNLVIPCVWNQYT